MVKKEIVDVPELLEKAMECWGKLSDFRSERERNKRFTYGDQWGDMITIDNQRVREEDYILSNGNMPLKNNLIRRLVRNVLGVFRNNYAPPRYASLPKRRNVILFNGCWLITWILIVWKRCMRVRWRIS